MFEDALWKARYQTICEGQLSTKQTSTGDIFQTNSKGSLYQRVFGKTCLQKNHIKRNLDEKQVWRENSSPKMVQTISLPKIISKNSTKETLKTHSLPKKNIRRTISTKASLKRHFPTKQIEETSLRKQHLKRNLYQKEWRNISTKKSEKRNITSNMARIGTDKTWWTNAFFLNFINFDFCSFSCRKQLDFLGWWFLLDLFSVKIFLDGLFG